jgi:hypothetical protein
VRVAVLLTILLCVPTIAAAQRIEIGGSFVTTGGYDAGEKSAVETPNSTHPNAPGLTLFTTTSTVTSANGVEGCLAVNVSRQIAVEGVFQIAWPRLQTRVADDFENAPSELAEGQFTSYLGGASLVYHFGTGRVVPFVAGGASYLRQLDEDHAGVVSGTEIHGGGGLKYWFGSGRRSLGLRAEAQLSSRGTSIGFEDKRQTLPTFGVGLDYRF